MQVTIAVEPHSCASRPTMRRGAAEAKAQPADVRGADGAHQPGRGQGLQASFRESRLLIDIRERRDQLVSVQTFSNATE